VDPQLTAAAVDAAVGLAQVRQRCRSNRGVEAGGRHIVCTQIPSTCFEV
jgi:hypothetical protein